MKRPGKEIDRSRLEDYVKAKFPGIFNTVTKRFNVAEVLSDSGAFQNLKMDQVNIGEAIIENLVIQGVDASVTSGDAYLENVRIVLELEVTLEWWIDIGFYEDTGSKRLDPRLFTLSIGNVDIDSLDEIEVNMPSIMIEDVQVDVPLISDMSLGTGNLSGMKINEIKIPNDGFQVSGALYQDFRLGSIQTPGLSAEKIRLDKLSLETEVVVPKGSLSNFELPTTPINNIKSGEIIIKDEANSKKIIAAFGVFGVVIGIKPIAQVLIDKLLIQDIELSARISDAEIEKLHLPLVLEGIELERVSLDDLSIRDING
ncbi:MAG: hypothetical protein H6657_15030 [Ardenticatenaceae bacterium]|nr:hypothetical protein [Ardenticatenaceae bacterium]